MDKFIVRFSVLALNMYMIVALAYAMNGIDISEYDYIFTDSLIIGIVLTTLVHVQGRYHCKWIRALCYNLNIVPSINFIDCKYPLFETAEGYIYFVTSIISISIIVTIILAIRHFTKVRRIKRQQYEIRRRNKSED